MLFEYVRRKREESLVDRACVKAALETRASCPEGSTSRSTCTPRRSAATTSSSVFLGDVADVNAISLNDVTVEIVEHAPPWDGRASWAR